MTNTNNNDKYIDWYIQFWDEFISSWFCNHEKYKTGDVYLDKMNIFLPNLMPEPYLGNPNKGYCSIALLNFNPGYNGNDVEYSQIEDVVKKHENKYSKVALLFPYKENIIEEDLLIFKSFKGTRWWKSRLSWVDQLINDTGKSNDNSLLPFALELCPWHSKNWDSKRFVKELDNVKFKDYVNNFVIQPYIKAISDSLCRFGVCVGKSFDKVLVSFNFEDVTTGYSKDRIESGKGLKLVEGKQRYYRIYKHKEQGTIVLNTWHEGGNHTPSIDFWPKERDIIQYIVNELIQK